MNEEKKLSDYILEGIPLVIESRTTYLSLKPHEGICGCAIGTAYYAKTKMKYIDRMPYIKLFDMFSKEFNIPIEILEEVSHMHMYGRTREECIKWLKSKGY